jgi:hypothetical protein
MNQGVGYSEVGNGDGKVRMSVAGKDGEQTVGGRNRERGGKWEVEGSAELASVGVDRNNEEKVFGRVAEHWGFAPILAQNGTHTGSAPRLKGDAALCLPRLILSL